MILGFLKVRKQKLTFSFLVQNLPEADLNENLGKKIKSEEIKVENVKKEEEETNDSLLEGEEDMSEYERIRQTNIQVRSLTLT